MLALATGLAGILIGWILKVLSDIFAEGRANKRADIVWRRQHYVDDVATLIHAIRELMSADSAISRAIFALGNAESSPNPEVVATCRAQHQSALERQAPWTTATARALEAVRLYAPDDVIQAANAAWDAVHNSGSGPDVRRLSEFEQSVLEALIVLREKTRDIAELA